MKTRNLALALGAFALAAASFAASATDHVFSNPASITNNDNSTASPYPSAIAVSGLSGNITKVTVTLNTMSHTWPGDLNVILVTPGGQKIALMQRVGTTALGCSTDLTSATLIFDAAAASNMSACSYPASGGTFLPTIGLTLTNSAAPAPAGPYSNDLGSLNGSGAVQNGTWNLYVSDHAGADSGGIYGGWTLNISDDTPDVTCASEGYTSTKLEWCKNICERGYTGSTLAMWIRRWTDRYRTLPYCALEPQPVPGLR
jgi:subtilisin-like proprotein convertase family protein